MGLQVEEQRDTETGTYTNTIEVMLERESGRHVVAGTLFGESDIRLVRIDDFVLEVKPEGHVLLYQNIDRPGMLASVGAILADSNINIGALALGRKEKGSTALTAVSVDEAIPEAVLAAIGAIEGVQSVRSISV